MFFKNLIKYIMNLNKDKYPSLYGIQSKNVECIICLTNNIPVYPKFKCSVKHYYCDECFVKYIDNCFESNRDICCAYCKQEQPIDDYVMNFLLEKQNVWCDNIISYAVMLMFLDDSFQSTI